MKRNNEAFPIISVPIGIYFENSFILHSQFFVFFSTFHDYVFDLNIIGNHLIQCLSGTLYNLVSSACAASFLFAIMKSLIDVCPLADHAFYVFPSAENICYFQFKVAKSRNNFSILCGR